MNALENYHLIMALAGTGLILAYWVPRFISGREPAPAALLIAAGSITGVLQPELAGLISPTIAPGYWEHITEVALIIGLFGTGLKFDRIKSWSHWQPTLRLLFIAMPATIVCLFFLVHILVG